MAAENKTIYLPKLPVRPGMRHSYQSAHGVKVVAVDPEKAKAQAKAASKKVVSTGDED